MGRKGVSITFKGFGEMIERIQKADRDIQPIVNDCMQKAVVIQERALKTAMAEKGVDADLINGMDSPKIEWIGNRCKATVGYEKGNYTPNDISDTYKLIFKNYGTPKMDELNFIEEAKKKGRKEIQKESKKALTEIIKEIDG